MPDMSFSVFFDNLNFKKIKIDLFDPVVLSEFRFAVAFKIGNVGIQPDRHCQIPGIADAVQSPENLVGSCLAGIVADYEILFRVIVFQDQTAPESKHVIVLSAGFFLPVSLFLNTISCGFRRVKFPCMQKIIILYYNQPASGQAVILSIF